MFRARRRWCVLDDAAQSGPFARDPYVAANKPKSVLCMPLVNQGKLSGLLYLENNLTTNAFTPERLEVIRVLSSQAAISIDNARLYSDLRRNEEKYRTLFEDLRDAIFVMNIDASIVDVNQATLDLFGYSRDEMLNLGLADIGVPMEAVYRIPAHHAGTGIGARLRSTVDPQGRHGDGLPAHRHASPR